MTQNQNQRSSNPIDTSTDPEEDPVHTNVNRHGLSRLTGKTAIVTGSTRGIGEGIARRYASERANVVVSGRSSEAGEAIAADINTAGGEAVFIRADMADPDDIESLITETVERYGSIDLLVNNAAAWNHGKFETRTMEDWEMVMNVSLRAPWLATKYALDAMPAGSSVINVSSIHAIGSDPGHFPYNVAKAGLNGMTRSMAIDLGELDINVNTIMPGPVRTTGPVPDDDTGRTARLNPANRRGRPNDVAGLAAYLATEESEFMTGASLTIDGGWSVCLYDKIGTYEDVTTVSELTE